MPLSSSSRDTSQGLWEIFIFVPFIFRTSSIYSYFSLSLFSRHDHNNYDQVVSLLEGADEVKQLKKESLMLYQSTCRIICSGHCGTLQNFAPFTFCYLNTDFELKLICNLVNYCRPGVASARARKCKFEYLNISAGVIDADSLNRTLRV